MLKMALFYCAINENCCSVDGGRGICPLFSSPLRGIWQLKSPHPREFAIQGKKNANARGSARGGWAQVELTDALVQNKIILQSETLNLFQNKPCNLFIPFQNINILKWSRWVCDTSLRSRRWKG